MFPIRVPARSLSPRGAIVGLLLAAMPLIPTTSGSITANATTLALGERVSDTVQLGQSGVAIVLPEGDWRISGLVRPRQAGAPYALAVLTKSDGQVLAGTVWVRAVGEVRFETSAMWCSDGGVRQHVEPIVGASGIGCWWVRVWTTALAPEDLQPYWRQAFSHLRREGIPLPRALLAVGYHLAGAGRTLTVEYSFNASQVTVAEVKEWGQAWQDDVRAAFADSSPPSPPRLP
jgi:hypothetical protein